ncbi:hypothetical protein HPP92_016851 [Vanilla planifolia]|uniref:TRF2/HOY1 PH-like domain-containing protein n=1 Tax=Vanilla planifolia TaxID=51239 RepID=A0A835QKY0_VANPL|nr:hypothetical protein HPP92_016851 [Vanilla planifolia]
MVQLPNFDKFRSEPKHVLSAVAPTTVAVKEEVEDALDEIYGPQNKRSKIAEPDVQLDGKMVMPPGSQYDPLDEPSPLGLRLKKSPSFLDMIQMRLSQQKSVSTSSVASSGFDVGKKKELKSTAVSGATDKMKASNFPASILKIGNWEYASRYEGDLVAKCYYAKHKLVWEVLDGGLKNKIEIQWSDITALKAACPENGPATLDIVCHQGLLNKHFEKLIQCDPRLKSLSQQSEITVETSCFEPSSLEEQDESKCIGIDNFKDNHGCSRFLDPKMSCAKTEARDAVDAVLDLSARQIRSHDSGYPTSVYSPILKNTSIALLFSRISLSCGKFVVLICWGLGVWEGASIMASKVAEDDYSDNRSTIKPALHWELVQVPKLKASMSKDDLVSHLEHCISEQLASGNPLISADCFPNKEKLEELANHLLTDSQNFVSDEKSLISKVNSFCCLLQKETSLQNLQTCVNARTEDNPEFLYEDPTQLHDRKVPGDPQSSGMSRKDSFGELLMNLPRIASFPQFLFSITEDNDDQ